MKKYMYVVGFYSPEGVINFEVIQAVDRPAAIDMAKTIAAISFPKECDRLTYNILRSDEDE